MQTVRAHCGHCAGPMVQVVTAEAIWFECLNPDCPVTTTEPRATAAEADGDVVWVPVTTPVKRRQADTLTVSNA